MKLAYSNWHKETVHDDAIQSELTNLTGGQLEFTNTPFVKAYRPQDNREQRGGYSKRGGGGGKYQQRAGGGGGRRDNRGGTGGGYKKKRY